MKVRLDQNGRPVNRIQPLGNLHRNKPRQGVASFINQFTEKKRVRVGLTRH